MENKRYRWDCIYDRIKDIKKPVGAEIGVHRGECSAHLLELHQGLTLYMIDMWAPDTYKGHEDGATEPYREMYENQCDENMDICLKNTADYYTRTRVVRSSSVYATEFVADKSLDFVFIDAAHDYESVKQDIEAWLPKIKKGGWMMFHDYGNPNFSGVEQAVDEKFPLLNPDDIDFDYFAAVRI